MKITSRKGLIIAISMIIGVTIAKLLFMSYFNYYINKTMSNFLVGIMGGIIGLLIFSLFSSRKNIKSILIPLFISGILFTSCDNIMNTKEEKYKTCEVCGYKAFNTKEGICEVCFSESWEEEVESGDYKNKLEWLKEEQLETFVIDSLNQKMDFSLPEDEVKSFKRDTSWKPIITKEDLIEAFLREENNN